MEKYKYKAFISYRHLSLDKNVAISLQNYLEKFKIAKNEKTWKVFRDESELPTSSDLSNDIDKALSESEFLIVICSKELKESKWCLQEISTFKSLHNGKTDNILAVLIDGMPSECFPEELCTSKVIVEYEKNQVYEDIEVEPLAANIVADTATERKKKQKVEYLRIAAQLMGVSFDELYNRKKRAEIKRKTTIFGSIAMCIIVISLAFAAYSFSMQAKINEQLRLTEIEKKKTQEQLELTEIERQKTQEQLQKTQLETAKYYLSQSEFFSNEGRARDGLENAIKSFEITEDNTPLLTKSVELLADQIGAFEKQKNLPIMRFIHDDYVDKMWLLKNGKRLLVLDIRGNLYLWNTLNKELIWKSDFYVEEDEIVMQRQTNLVAWGGLTEKNKGSFTAKGSGFYGSLDTRYKRKSPEKDLFGMLNSFIVLRENSWMIINANDGTQREIELNIKNEIQEEFMLLTSQNDTWLSSRVKKIQGGFLAEDDECIYSYSENGELVATLIKAECDIGIKKQDICFLAERLLIVKKEDTQAFNKDEILLYSLDADKVSTPIVLPVNGVSECNVYDIGNECYIIEACLYNGMYLGDSSTLFYIDGKDMRIKWQTGDEVIGIKSSDKNIGYLKEKEVVYFLRSNRIGLFDSNSGNKLGEISFQDSILDYYIYNKEVFVVTLVTGETFVTTISGIINNSNLILLDNSSCDISTYDYVAGFEAKSNGYSKYVDIYADTVNDNCEKLYEATDEGIYIDDVFVSSDGDIYVVNLYHSIWGINSTTKDKWLIDSISEDEYYSDMFLLGHQLYVQYKYEDDDYTVLNIENGKYVGNWRGERYYGFAVLPQSEKIVYPENDELIISDYLSEMRIDLNSYFEGRGIYYFFVGNDGRSVIVNNSHNEMVFLNENQNVRKIKYQSHLDEGYAINNICISSGNNKMCVIEKKKDSFAYIYDFDTEKTIVIEIPNRELIQSYITDEKIYLFENRYRIHIADFDGNIIGTIELSNTNNRATAYKFWETENNIIVKEGGNFWIIDKSNAELKLKYVYGGLGLNPLYEVFDNKNNKLIFADNSNKLISFPLYSAEDIYKMAKSIIK